MDISKKEFLLALLSLQGKIINGDTSVISDLGKIDSSFDFYEPNLIKDMLQYTGEEIIDKDLDITLFNQVLDTVEFDGKDIFRDQMELHAIKDELAIKEFLSLVLNKTYNIADEALLFTWYKNIVKRTITIKDNVLTKKVIDKINTL